MIRELIERAIKIAGSEEKLGKLCDCSQHKIWKAKVTEKVDAELALKIESATRSLSPDDFVTARSLRPDLPWPAQSEHQTAVAG